jgi:tetratricopeptide (TPR) repeat protein
VPAALRSWAFHLTLVLAVLALPLGACGGDDQSGADKASDLVQQGLTAQRDDRLDDARDLYRRAIEADDRNKFAHYNLGLVEQTTDHAAAAEQHYREAVAIDPNFAAALFNLAILRTQAGASDEAVNLYQRVTTLEDDNAAAHLNLGLLLDQLGRRAEAAQELDRAAAPAPASSSRQMIGNPAYRTSTRCAPAGTSTASRPGATTTVSAGLPSTRADQRGW